MYCSKCGWKNDEDAVFCIKCGEQMGGSAETTSNVLEQEVKEKELQENQGKNGNKKVFLLIAVALAIIVIVFLVGKGGGETSKNEIVDLYEYRMATEEVLRENLGFEANEFGAYPSLDDMIITCMDGSVYSIVLTDSSVGKYSFLGIQVGDDKENAEEKLKDICAFIDTIPVSGNMFRDTYADNEYGAVILDYDMTNNVVKSIGYVAEDATGNGMYYEEPYEEQSSYTYDTAVQYGSYTNSTESGICYAEVGIATGFPSGDYIQFSLMGYGGHEQVSFYGMLEGNSNGTYTAYDEIFEATIQVEFSSYGMEVVVENALYSDMYQIEGFYDVESLLNLNEVG